MIPFNHDTLPWIGPRIRIEKSSTNYSFCNFLIAIDSDIRNLCVRERYKQAVTGGRLLLLFSTWQVESPHDDQQQNISCLCVWQLFLGNTSLGRYNKLWNRTNNVMREASRSLNGIDHDCYRIHSGNIPFPFWEDRPFFVREVMLAVVSFLYHQTPWERIYSFKRQWNDNGRQNRWSFKNRNSHSNITRNGEREYDIYLNVVGLFCFTVIPIVFSHNRGVFQSGNSVDEALFVGDGQNSIFRVTRLI